MSACSFHPIPGDPEADVDDEGHVDLTGNLEGALGVLLASLAVFVPGRRVAI